MSEPLPTPPAPAAEALRHLSRLRRRDRVLLLAPSLALGLVMLALWLFAGWFVVERPKKLREQQLHELGSAVRAAAIQTEAVLRQAETALRVVDLWALDRQVGRAGDDAQLAHLAESLSGSSSRLMDVMLVARSGRVHWLQAGHENARKGLISDAVYADLAGRAPEGLTLGEPLQLEPGNDDSRWQLPMLMRLSRPLGDLDTVLVLIDLSRLRDLQSLFLTGPDPALLMLRADGTVLLREPALPGLMGRNLFERLPGRDRDFAAPEGRFATDGSSTDGRIRVGAYATLGDFGVKLLLSNSETGLQTAYSWQRNLVLGATIVLTLLLGGLAGWLSRLQRTARLRAAELRATSNAMPLGLFRCDRSGRTVYANDTYLRLHGLAREDLEWGWASLVPPDERDMLILRWKHQMSSGEPVDMVRRIRLPGATHSRLMAIHTAPLIVGGRITGQVGAVEDVTERGEQALAHQTLAAIFDMTPDLVLQTNERGDISYLNPAVRARLGLAPDAALAGRHIRQFFDAAQLAHYEQQVLPAARQAGQWQGRTALTLGVGPEVPVEATVLVHLDLRGRVETVSMILRDISDTLRAQRERERGEAMLLAVAQTARAQFLVGDTEGRLLFCNASFEREHGVLLADWVGRPLAELFTPQDYALRRAAFEQALGGEIWRGELSSGEARGQRVFEVQCAPLRVQSGQIEGLILIELEITEARREAARLRQASQTDTLTQLLNRAGFDAGAARLLQDLRAPDALPGRHLALLYLDLDRFKPVNDTHGHPTGDALLKAVALRLRHTLRPDDLVARLGGDEFAVMLAGLNHPDDAGRIADKLLQVVQMPFHIGTLKLEIGVSIGYSVVSDSGAELPELVAAADAHLYDAKRAGRGCWRGSSLHHPQES